MGSKKISQLPSIVTPSLSGVTVVVDSGTTYNITLDDLKTVLKDEISEGSSGTSGTSGTSGSAGTSVTYETMTEQQKQDLASKAAANVTFPAGTLVTDVVVETTADGQLKIRVIKND